MAIQRLARERSRLEDELQRCRETENQLREQLRRSESRCGELEGRLDEVVRREREIIARLQELGKKLSRLRQTIGAEKQLTVINQRKFRREIASLRHQLTEATEKLRAAETVTVATRSREILAASTDDDGELVEMWNRLGIKHAQPADTGQWRGLYSGKIRQKFSGKGYSPPP